MSLGGLWSRLFPPPTADEFARRMIRALRAAGQAGNIEYDPTAFRLIFDGDGSHTLFLHNAYQDFLRGSRGQRRKVLSHYANVGRRIQAVSDEDFTTVKSRLLPRVRDRMYHEGVRLHFLIHGDGGKDSLVSRPITEDFSLDLVQDHPDSIQTVSASSLAGWKVTFDEALAAAKENLWKSSNEDFIPIRPGLYRSPWQDKHDASRIFLHDLIWQLKVKGEHVVIAPSRDLLMVTGSEDNDGLRQMTEIAEQVLTHPRPMSGLAMRLQGSHWAPFLPPLESPAYKAMRELATSCIVTMYEEQTALLRSLVEKHSQDVFVPRVNAVASPEGVTTTFTTWIDAVTDGLLPRAERVYLGRMSAAGENQILGSVDWARLQEAAGDLLTPTEHYPPRYRTAAFPSVEQLRRMGIDPPVQA